VNGLEDLRGAERLMQFFGLLNQILAPRSEPIQSHHSTPTSASSSGSRTRQHSPNSSESATPG
jgi:hypothetical protein